jgi:Zn-dependent protease with chaperone function
MIVTVSVLAVLTAILVFPLPSRLASAEWTFREPRAALVLWQSIGLATGLTAVVGGVALGIAPLADTFPGAVQTWSRAVAGGDPTGGLGLSVSTALLLLALILLARLLGMLLLSVRNTIRSRRRHREVVDLLGSPWSGDQAARVIDHPGVAAYCLPGAGNRVVLTAGTVELLDEGELAAVLAHERAHLAERHHLVLLPFTAWSAALPWIPGVRAARSSVAQLIEFVADDRACGGCDRDVLAAALARVGTASHFRTTPAGAMAAGDSAVLTRVRRLLDPPARLPLARRMALIAALVLVLSPVLTICWPFL